MRSVRSITLDVDLVSMAEGIMRANPRLFSRFDPKTCIAEFDAVPADRAYHFVPDGVQRLWAGLQTEFGEDGFAAFQQATMLALIADFDERRADKRYTDDIVALFERSYARIAASISDHSCAQYRSEDDLLLKDLALARQHVFPAGAEIVEPDAQFARSLMLRDGIGQAVKMIRLLLETGGNDHWYQMHTHLSELDDFNEAGWTRTYLRLAAMLELNPEVRGMYGGSWFYDPALEQISPHLTHLREVRERAGAYVFFARADPNSGALTKSRRRQALYKEGKYMPKSFVVIWPRRQMLKWAEKHRRDHRA